MNYALLLILIATTSSAPDSEPSARRAPSVVATAREVWEGTVKNITAAAEQVSEANYAYRPVGTVRTFGQLIGHLAGSQNLICGSAMGAKTAAEDDVEKNVTTKDALVTALKASTARCAKAYAMSDADAAQTHSLFGADRTALWALTQNAVHDGEHYGNIVTYMRMLNMVPPSSQPAPRTP